MRIVVVGEDLDRRKASSNTWTIDERKEVIDIFCERAKKALVHPLASLQDLADPCGGIKIHFTLNKNGTGEIEMDVFDDNEYDQVILTIRPFILVSQSIFLPKIPIHLQRLVKQDYIYNMKCLEKYVNNFFQNNEFTANFSLSCIVDKNTKEKFIATTSEIGKAYIYGKSAKVDIKQRNFLKKFSDPKIKPEYLSLNMYLWQLLRVIYTINNQINLLNSKDAFIS